MTLYDGCRPTSSLSVQRSSLPIRFLGGCNGTFLGLLLVVFALCPLLAGAQELTATLAGRVTDTTGAVISNATVTIIQNGVGDARTVQTDASGNYVVTNLPAGTYTATVTSAGFETFRAKDVVLNVAEKRGLNIQLRAGATSTTVTVEASAVSVDTESSAQAGTITGEQIRN